ncbi:androgen-induced gene 1 protein-like [Wyeomyia smithii]|uniref:androgen-induced gene 1 protein-like n=1 Tax=Wyeomyia smithii TaxID=174621 RepID=UPI002467E1EF|nr:androgen-induced gene 1 protein-like [Wyeomyia smithii]
MADLRVLLHLVATLNSIFGLYGFSNIEFPSDLIPFGVKFGGIWKYLTIWNSAMQVIYFTLSLINDLIGSNELAPRRVPMTRKIKDYLFAAFVFPGAMLVAITFWGILAIDRELIHPKVLEPIFPYWLNHALHTNIVLFMLLELYTSFRQYPSRKSGLAGLLTFGIGYLTWLHVIHNHSGVWVYSVIEVLAMPLRFVFFAFIIGLSIGLYLFGELFNNSVWVREMWTLRSATRKSKLT